MIRLDRVQMAEDLSFSRIVHGLWRLADWKLSDEELITLIEQCFELGITTFDHADIYGSYTCESLFGRALEKSRSSAEKWKLLRNAGLSSSHQTGPSINHIITIPEKNILSLLLRNHCKI